jgi:hypothetical protein
LCAAFYQWWWEPTSDPVCKFTAANGHRWNIAGSHSGIGMGFANVAGSRYRNYWAHDFAPATLRKGLVSGAHESTGGQRTVNSGQDIEFRANFYDGQKPSSALINIGGKCYVMAEERSGVVNGGHHVAYLATVAFNTSTFGACARYRFEFVNAAGNQTEVLPAVGSYGVGDAATCADYSSAAPAQCQGSISTTAPPGSPPAGVTATPGSEASGAAPLLPAAFAVFSGLVFLAL